MNESTEDVDEPEEDTMIDFSVSEYVSTYGNSPRGRGSWAFAVAGAPAKADGSDVFWTPGSTTYADAKKIARAHFSKLFPGGVVLTVLT